MLASSRRRKCSDVCLGGGRVPVVAAPACKVESRQVAQPSMHEVVAVGFEEQLGAHVRIHGVKVTRQVGLAHAPAPVDQQAGDQRGDGVCRQRVVPVPGHARGGECVVAQDVAEIVAVPVQHAE